MTLHATWLIGGHDLEPICVVEDLSGALGPATLRGAAVAIPYKSGRLTFSRTLDVRQLSLGLAILDVDPGTGLVAADPTAQFFANWQTVRGWFLPVDTTDPNRLVVPPITITQRLTLPSGVQEVTGTAEVDPSSLFPTTPSGSTGRAVVNLNVVDGALLYT